MIGRGLRGLRVGGNKEVIVIDVKDNFSAYSLTVYRKCVGRVVLGLPN